MHIDNPQVIADWVRAGEAADADTMIKLLAEDVELISPLTEAFRFHGPRQVGRVCRAAVEIIEGIRFHTHVGDGSTHALFYRARCAGQFVEEAQLLRLDDAGAIREITLFGRPLPALTVVMKRIGPRLMELDGRPALGRALGAGIVPVHALLALVEKRVVPLAAPRG